MIELPVRPQPTTADLLPVPSTWRQRLVSRFQPHIDSFRQGGGIAVAMVGLGNMRAGLLADRSDPEQVKAAIAAFATGILQMGGGMKIAYPSQPECAPLTGTFTGATAGVWLSLGVLLPKVWSKIDHLAHGAKIAIMVTFETGSALVIGGVTSQITTVLARKTVDLYYACREARARRANPEAGNPLLTDDADDEPMQVQPAPQPAT